ncbi:MAG: serine protease [Gammaproteobacteria bacterium RIFCSPLOWO2_02_FULL_56_15]|nr:MAG: serine protease [Gammaproteobacteria bacterium RIFCSPLOWO2_02_FULL_56_15]
MLRNPLFRVFYLLASVVVCQVQAGAQVLVLDVQDAIGPAVSDYIQSGLEHAHDQGVRLIVIRLDTPGGLDTSMRDIIRAIIASPIPVAIYVSPSGARAASAGTYLLYAAHIAAMAPGTNVGAATPIQIGGLPDLKPGDVEPGQPVGNAPETEGEPSGDAMQHKLINDAVAYLRSLAEMRGRNAVWAELAVREAASLTAQDALAEGVIDIMATDLSDLLRQLNGMSVEIEGREMSLDIGGAQVEFYIPDWRNRFLAVITNPSIAYIFMLLGIYGLFFELAHPGFVLPGVLGGICLLLALYAMQVLPVNYAGLALILLGIAFMIAELIAPSFGVLGIGGIAAFVMGSLILFDKAGPFYTVPLQIIGVVTLVAAIFTLAAIRLAVSAHQRPVVTGREQMIGATGVVVDDFMEAGRLFIHGETWNAVSEVPMHKGQLVEVVAINGLELKIKPIIMEES